jgi:hypothetical protein
MEEKVLYYIKYFYQELTQISIYTKSGFLESRSYNVAPGTIMIPTVQSTYTLDWVLGSKMAVSLKSDFWVIC